MTDADYDAAYTEVVDAHTELLERVDEIFLDALGEAGADVDPLTPIGP